MRAMVTLGVLVSLGACSAADGGGSGDRSNGINAPPVPSANAGSGAAGTGAESPGGFGNPNGPSSTRPPPPPGADAGCTEGFCGPSTPDGDCGSFIVKTDVEVTVTPGNLLVVFDESASMQEMWPATGTNKLTAAQQALTTALMPLQDLLTVGAIFFPTTACFGPPISFDGMMVPPSVAPLTAAPQIPFQKGPQFLQAWTTHWMQVPAAGLPIGTPVNEAFDQAAIALDAALAAGTITGSTIVALFTDGAPTCTPDTALTGVASKPEISHAQEWLMKHGIKTYVVGLPGAGGVQLLDDIAVNGGTTSYILPENTMDLEMKLRTAVEETVKTGLNSCSISLDPAPEAPEKLHLVVFEATDPTKGFDVDRMLSDDAGWTLSADSKTVELTGTLCEDALAGRFEKVTFQYGCVDVPPLPKPPPVM